MTSTFKPHTFSYKDKKILVWNECPPIPDRRFDYVATVDDGNEDGLVGHGATAADAVEDLLQQLDDE